MKPELKVYSLAGLVAFLAILMAVMEAFLRDKLFKLAAAGKSFGDPEVMDTLNIRHWIDAIIIAQALAIWFCYWNASKIELGKGGKLWEVVLVVLFSLIFGYGGFI